MLGCSCLRRLCGGWERLRRDQEEVWQAMSMQGEQVEQGEEQHAVSMKSEKEVQ